MHYFTLLVSLWISRQLTESRIIEELLKYSGKVRGNHVEMKGTTTYKILLSMYCSYDTNSLITGN